MKKGNNFMFGLMTIKELAEELKTVESTVYSWKRSGAIPPECFKQIGGRVYAKQNEIQKWL